MPLPRVLGEFELANKVGESAVGEVYRAHHRQTGRGSHVRILAKSYTHDEEAIRLAVSSIHETPPIAHPNIGGGCMYVSDLAAGRVGDRVYLVFSTAQVLDLEALAHDGPLSWSDVRWMMLDICCGLDAAHRLHYMPRRSPRSVAATLWPRWLASSALLHRRVSARTCRRGRSPRSASAAVVC